MTANINGVISILASILLLAMTPVMTAEEAKASFKIENNVLIDFGNTGIMLHGKRLGGGWFTFRFSEEAIDALYQISVSNNGPQITWEVLSRTIYGFDLNFTIQGQPYDPPELCVVSTDR